MSDHHDDHDLHDLYEEPDHLAIARELRAYQGGCAIDDIPPGYNAYVLPIDLGLSSPLSWKKEEEIIEQLIQKGYDIVFDIELGIFTTEGLSLQHTAQFQSLALAFDHFKEQILDRYSNHIKGIIALQVPVSFYDMLLIDQEMLDNFYDWLVTRFGSIEQCNQELTVNLEDKDQFSLATIKNAHLGLAVLELYARDVIIDFISLLFSRIPEHYTCYILLNAAHISSPLLFASLISKDRYDRFFLAIKESIIPTDNLVWQSGCDTLGYIGNSQTTYTQLDQRDETIGIVMPRYDVMPTRLQELTKAFSTLINHKIPFRIISEEHITIGWDGIDHLIVSSQCISTNSLRKLRGFIATGGCVVYTDKTKTTSEQECSLDDWVTIMKWETLDENR